MTNQSNFFAEVFLYPLIALFFSFIALRIVLWCEQESPDHQHHFNNKDLFLRSYITVLIALLMIRSLNLSSSK